MDENRGTPQVHQLKVHQHGYSCSCGSARRLYGGPNGIRAFKHALIHAKTFMKQETHEIKVFDLHVECSCGAKLTSDVVEGWTPRFSSYYWARKHAELTKTSLKNIQDFTTKKEAANG